MLNRFKGLAAGLLLAGCATASATAPTPVVAQPAPNILVFTEDSDRDTIPRNSRVNRQVLQEVQNQFNQEGYRYYDETAVGLGYMAENRTRRQRSELLQIARSVDTPIDIVVQYAIYASVNKLDFMTEAAMRVEGEMIDVTTGQGLGTFEVEADEKFKLPLDCSRECVLEEMSSEARDLGADLGRALVRLVNDRWVVTAAAPSSGAVSDGAAEGGSSASAGFVRVYDLCFDKFNQDEMLGVEELFVTFGGYRNHRISEQQSTKTCYQYESSSDQAKLGRNLKRAIDYLDLRGDINSSGNNAFDVVAVPRVKLHPTDNAPRFE